MITQPEEGSWYLEDLTSLVKLDLTQAQTFPVFYTEGSIVFIEGEYKNNVFIVDQISLPPLEDREATMKSLGISDIFSLNQRPQLYYKMLEMEKEAEDQMVVIISEIHLDKPLVLEKLEAVFRGFEESSLTPLYILIGSFFSKSYFTINGGKQIMKNCFQQLSEILAKYPLQSTESKFLFIPGEHFINLKIDYSLLLYVTRSTRCWNERRSSQKTDSQRIGGISGERCKTSKIWN